MLRTARSLPLHRAFVAGLRPGPFPDRAASLLPGLLAATRTGLAPAGDDELTNLGHLHRSPPVPLGARTIRVSKGVGIRARRSSSLAGGAIPVASQAGGAAAPCRAC